MTDDATDRRGLFRDLFGSVGRAVGSGAGSGSIFESLESLAGSQPDDDEPGLELPGRSPLSSRTATLDETLAAAGSAGLESRADPLRAAVRHSICLQPGRPRADRGVIVGGHPRLPRGTDWPEWEESPLSFLAQVELGAFPFSAEDPGPPEASRLLFFYEDDQRPSGFDAGHLGAAAVLALTGDESSEWVIDGDEAEASAEMLIPRASADSVEALDLSVSERAGWEEVRKRLAEEQETQLTDGLPEDHIVHRIFGYPDNPGGDMPLICELAANGYDAPEDPAAHPEASRLRERSGRWELLAQFSADYDFGWSWGEPGERLHFWIDRDALTTGDFSRVRAIVR